MSFSIFIIIGAQRSGTTSLCKVLDKHPEITLAKPLKPEPKFFLNKFEFDKGKSHYINKYYPAITERNKYLGEKSTSYYENSFVAQRIYSYFPEAKIIVLLRNPVDRALSNYFFSKSNGLEKRTLSEVFIQNHPPPINNQKVSVSPFDYIKRSSYSALLDPYFKLFRHNIKVVIFEEMIRNKSVIQDLFVFLGLDQDIGFSLEVSNTSDLKKDKDVDKDLSTVRNYLFEKLRNEVERTELLLGRKVPHWY